MQYNKGSKLKIMPWKTHFGKIYSLVMNAILEEVLQRVEGFSGLRKIQYSTRESHISPSLTTVMSHL